MLFAFQCDGEDTVLYVQGVHSDYISLASFLGSCIPREQEGAWELEYIIKLVDESAVTKIIVYHKIPSTNMQL